VRLALLSDIHSNTQALDTCLAHAAARGIDRLAFLGDFVGYGGDPGGVVRTVAAKVREGAIALKGNHDEAVEKGGGYFNEAAMAAIDLARETLDAGQRRFLDGLPLIVRDGDVCLVHASAANPAKWDYVDSPSAALRCADAAQTPYVFCGHVHDQALYFESVERKMREFKPISGVAIPVRRGRRWVALVGSVGQPRDRNPAAAYAIFDDVREQITFFRVRYDARAAAQVIRESGLPASLAYRVEQGI
jgi:diadenosine tetraphosphatase ApaH/serine/threonine PP2A family protein phosphatase